MLEIKKQLELFSTKIWHKFCLSFFRSTIVNCFNKENDYYHFWCYFQCMYNMPTFLPEKYANTYLLHRGFYYMKCGKFTTQVRLYPYFTCGYGRRSLSSSSTYNTRKYISNRSIPSICVVLKKNSRLLMGQ